MPQWKSSGSKGGSSCPCWSGPESSRCSSSWYWQVDQSKQPVHLFWQTLLCVYLVLGPCIWSFGVCILFIFVIFGRDGVFGIMFLGPVSLFRQNKQGRSRWGLPQPQEPARVPIPGKVLLIHQWSVIIKEIVSQNLSGENMVRHLRNAAFNNQHRNLNSCKKLHNPTLNQRTYHSHYELDRDYINSIFPTW